MTLREGKTPTTPISSSYSLLPTSFLFSFFLKEKSVTQLGLELSGRVEYTIAHHGFSGSSKRCIRENLPRVDQIPLGRTAPPVQAGTQV